MIVQPADGSAERRVLIACITNTEFLSRLVGKLGKDPFRSDTGNQVWDWCSKHYLKYQQAPEKLIESIFSTHCRTNTDKEKNQSISRLLHSLSGQFQNNGHNTSYDLDLAEQFFNEISLGRLNEEMSLLLSKSQYKQASELQRLWLPVDLHSPPFTDLLADKDAQRKALEESQNVLIKFPGDLGKFFGEEFAEDSLIAFMAPAKGQKSFSLLHIAWLAMLQGRKVAYFQVGDLSRGQVLRRFHRRAVRRPWKAGILNYPEIMTLATDEDGRPAPLIEYKQLSYDNDLDWSQAELAYEEILRKVKGRIRLSYHHIKTVSMLDIQRILKQWDRDEWKAQVVVIDYAGNLSAVDTRHAPHEQVNQTWGLMRQISEMRKCLVVTANQSNKESFSTWVLTRKHFAESKYVLAHCTSFIGINTTAEEQQMGIHRYNFVVRREGRFSETECCWCASCLEIANPCVLSCLPERS